MQVYIIYPEAINLAGPAAVHELVPNWESLERVLAVRRQINASSVGVLLHPPLRSSCSLV
jgi:hypothetical protein